MRGFQFRLATVLRLRRAEDERAHRALVEANAVLTALLLRRDEEARRTGELVRRAEATDAPALLAERHDAEVALAQLGEADRRVAEAAGAAALAQVTWVRAHRRVQALERLEERQRAEHGAELLRQEISLLDDLATARYLAAGNDRTRLATGSDR